MLEGRLGSARAGAEKCSSAGDGVMDENVLCISSDSNPPSSPTDSFEFDDDSEFPTAKLNEICRDPTGLQLVGKCRSEDLKRCVPDRPGKSEVFASSLSAQSGSLFDVLPGLSSSQPREGLPKTSSFHELSDSDSCGDAAKPDSPTFDISRDLAGSSPIWDLVGSEIAVKRAIIPAHELSDSDSDRTSGRTMPAEGSSKNMRGLINEYTAPNPVTKGYPTNSLFPGRSSPKQASGSNSEAYGSNSEDDSSTIHLSNSSFKLDPPLYNNILHTFSCASPPPGSPNPFVNLSDDSTQPPSTVNLLEDAGPSLLQSNSEPLLSTSCSISEFITQSDASSQPVDLSSGPKPSRKRAKNSAEDVFERKRLKEMKEKDKAEKAAAAESLRRLRPGECLKVGSSTPVEESHIIFLWSIDKLLTSIQFSTFIDTFADMKNKYSSYKLLLAVYGLHEYYKKQHKSEQQKKRAGGSRNPSGPPVRKRKSSFEVTATQIEMELIALQVRLGISHKALNSPQETACFLQMITRSVAELPFKLERERIDVERNWYAKGDSRNCARVDKDFNGLSQLWLQQLAQFNNSSLDTAKAIAQIYPTPLSLYNAYKGKATSKEKEQMLQEIVIRRGPGRGGRRLGPELSKKISIMFCHDKDVLLG